METNQVTEAKAVVRSVRIAPRKVKLVVDLIRGKDVGDAYALLRNIPKRSAIVIGKLLKSAVANAEHNYQLDQDNLFIKKIYVGEAKTLKRMQPHAQGRAFQILKRSSHIYITVAERE